MKLGHHTPLALPLLSAAAVLLLSSGCAVLNHEKSPSHELPGAVQAAADQPSATAAQPPRTITLEVRADGKKPDISPTPINGSPRIQEILEQTGLVKKFRRMDLVVMRMTGEQRQKMKSDYDHNKGWVNPLYDYQLHPGDHLIVTEDTSNVFDDMLNSLTPLRH